VPAARLLVVLTSDPDGPVVRHRWRAFAPALEAAGIVLEVVDWPKDPDGRRRALHRAETADGVVVSSRLLRMRDTKAMRRRVPRLGFDFDDALPYRDSARGAKPTRTRRRRFKALLRASDLVIAGNDYLAGLASRHGVEARVVPTVVDVPPGNGTAEPPFPPPVMGWIGSRSTLPYLEGVWVVLSAVVATGRPIKVRVIADGVPEFPPGIAVDGVRWTEDGWRVALGQIHLGLAPLPDDAWTRGKCGLKVLQTMSVGRPIVASAVGVQRDQVMDGVTGFLAESRMQFLDGLLKLIGDAELRRRMGKAALDHVRAHWSVEVWAPRLVEVIDGWLV
jgi:glycosyltransferase involved in cell wall biosynthesis